MRGVAHLPQHDQALLVAVAAAASVLALGASPADAKIAAIYGAGQGSLQNTGDTSLQGGFEVGARVTIVDAYVDYMSLGSGKTISRGIVGLRGALGVGPLQVESCAGGVGAIRADEEALMLPARTVGIPRTGRRRAPRRRRRGQHRAARMARPGRRRREVVCLPRQQLPEVATHSSDVLGTLKLTFELGI